MQNYSDQDYYWAKAEFQDSVAHRQHVENYKQGKPDCDFFHEEYRLEALKELYAEYKKECGETVGSNGKNCAKFNEWYYNVYKENGGVL